MLANRSMSQATVIPELAYPDVGQAVDWLCDTFRFTLRLRIANHRAQMNIPPDGNFVVTELRDATASAGNADHGMMIRVENVDAHFERVRSRDVTIVHPPTDYPYGERQYTVIDFAGHRWTFSQTIADIDPRDWGGEPGDLRMPAT